MALENLEELWTHASPGNLSALEQCKAWALREVAKDAGEDVNMALVARKLKVKGGEAPPARLSANYTSGWTRADGFLGRKSTRANQARPRS